MNFGNIAKMAKNVAGDNLNKIEHKAGGLLGGLKNPAMESLAAMKLKTQGFAKDQASKLINGQQLQGLGQKLAGGLAGKPQGAMHAAQNAAQGALQGASHMASSLAQKPHDVSRGIVSQGSKLINFGKGLF